MVRRFALLLVVSSAFAFADDVTRLRVEVQSLSGKPVDRAAVVVKFVEGRSVIRLGKKMMTNWEVRTNQEGVARIPEMPQGKVRVQVIARGYQTFGQTLDLTEPEQTLNIKLNPPQPQHTEHQ